MTKIYDQRYWGNFWVFRIQQKWSFGKNLDTRIRINVVLPHLKKEIHMIIVAWRVFRTVTFSSLSAVWYQSGADRVLVYCADCRKWDLIYSKPEIFFFLLRLVITNAYGQYQASSEICNFLVGEGRGRGVKLCPATLHHFKIPCSLKLPSGARRHHIGTLIIIFQQDKRTALCPNNKWGVWVAWSSHP